jgi:hypothetical protein
MNNPETVEQLSEDPGKGVADPVVRIHDNRPNGLQASRALSNGQALRLQPADDFVYHLIDR